MALSWPKKVKVLVTQSCPTLGDPMGHSPQAPLTMRFPWQEYWSGLPCPPPGDLPNSGIKLKLLHFLQWQADSLTTEPLGKSPK